MKPSRDVYNRSRSTIGGGGDTTISSPGWSPKQPLPRIGLHDLLYDGRQACPEFNLFHQRGWSNMSPGGAIFVPFPFKTGTNSRHPRPPQSLNDSSLAWIETHRVWRGVCPDRFIFLCAACELDLKVCNFSCRPSLLSIQTR